MMSARLPSVEISVKLTISHSCWLQLIWYQMLIYLVLGLEILE